MPVSAAQLAAAHLPALNRRIDRVRDLTGDEEAIADHVTMSASASVIEALLEENARLLADGGVAPKIDVPRRMPHAGEQLADDRGGRWVVDKLTFQHHGDPILTIEVNPEHISTARRMGKPV